MSHLKAYLSDDDGSTWCGGLMLDERERVSYPDATEGEDGVINVVYDRQRYTEREILLATFMEGDIRAGHCVTSVCRLQQLVNKAGPW